MAGGGSGPASSPPVPECLSGERSVRGRGWSCAAQVLPRDCAVCAATHRPSPLVSWARFCLSRHPRAGAHTGTSRGGGRDLRSPSVVSLCWLPTLPRPGLGLVGAVGRKLGTEDRTAAGKGPREGRDAGTVRGGQGAGWKRAPAARSAPSRRVGEVFPPSVPWGCLPSRGTLTGARPLNVRLGRASSRP